MNAPRTPDSRPIHSAYDLVRPLLTPVDSGPFGEFVGQVLETTNAFAAEHSYEPATITPIPYVPLLVGDIAVWGEAALGTTDPRQFRDGLYAELPAATKGKTINASTEQIRVQSYPTYGRTMLMFLARGSDELDAERMNAFVYSRRLVPNPRQSVELGPRARCPLISLPLLSRQDHGFLHGHLWRTLRPPDVSADYPHPGFALEFGPVISFDELGQR